MSGTCGGSESGGLGEHQAFTTPYRSPTNLPEQAPQLGMRGNERCLSSVTVRSPS